MNFNISYNQLSLILGAAIIITCSGITYLFQKKYFNKYKNKVKNSTDMKSK